MRKPLTSKQKSKKTAVTTVRTIHSQRVGTIVTHAPTTESLVETTKVQTHVAMLGVRSMVER